MSETVTLGEIAQIVDCEHKTAPASEPELAFAYSVGTPALRGSNIDFSQAKPVSRETYLSWSKRAELRQGDVILAREAPIGGVGYIDGLTKVCLGQRTVLVRTNPQFADSRFVFFLLRSPGPQTWMEMHSEGSTVRHLNVADVRRISLGSLPPLEEQRKIAGVLGGLDDLIEVNRKLIADLVDTVDAAFMRTFGGRPLALRVGELAKVIDCLHSKKPEQAASGKLYLQLNNVLDNGLLSLDSTYLIDTADYQRWTRNIEATEWDCVITNVGRVGAVARIPANVRAALGRNMTGIRPTMAEVDGAFIAAALRSSPVRREIALKTDSGTILDALNVKNIAGLRLPMSDEAERRVFQGIAGPMLRAADELMGEIRDLKATRDELLPLLMSGRVRVGDVSA